MNSLFAQVTRLAPRPTPAAGPVPPAVPANDVAATPAQPRLARLHVRDLVTDALVGIYPQEKTTPQRVRVNLELAVADPGPAADDTIASVVSYEEAVRTVLSVLGAGHINLLETVAERIAARILADTRIHSVLVRVEKLDAFPQVGAVGVEIVRGR